METIGERLNYIIDTQFYGNLSAFARKSNVDEALIRCYTRGTTLPRCDKVLQMADAAGVTCDWIISGRTKLPSVKDRMLNILENQQRIISELLKQKGISNENK